MEPEPLEEIAAIIAAMPETSNHRLLQTELDSFRARARFQRNMREQPLEYLRYDTNPDDLVAYHNNLMLNARASGFLDHPQLQLALTLLGDLTRRHYAVLAAWGYTDQTRCPKLYSIKHNMVNGDQRTLADWTPADVQSILSVLTDGEALDVLVHCREAYGVNYIISLADLGMEAMALYPPDDPLANAS